MKKTLLFDILIHADRKRVWDTMLDDATYRDWTTAFCAGSYYEGSWHQGASMRFLSAEGGGMVAVIAENRPHEFVSIKHLGEIGKDGVEDTQSEKVRSWAPALENYTFTEIGSSTEVSISCEITPDYEDYMNRTWPKALARLKELAEARMSA